MQLSCIKDTTLRTETVKQTVLEDFLSTMCAEGCRKFIQGSQPSLWKPRSLPLGAGTAILSAQVSSRRQASKS